jgi:hypothetical protein
LGLLLGCNPWLDACASATIPPLLQDATLEELYLSDTGLTGGLPDVVLEGSPLRVIFAVGSGNNEGVILEGDRMRFGEPRCKLRDGLIHC